MFVNKFTTLAASSPFFDAYFQSDFLGKVIFLSLIFLSITTWSILIHKFFITRGAKNLSLEFSRVFLKCKKNPLNLDEEQAFRKKGYNPFFDLYQTCKKYSIDFLNKNHKFGSKNAEASYLSTSDIESIAAHLSSCVDLQTKNLEKNLFVLSTIVGLAPLLGLLGTVWGILTTFSSMQTHAASSTNQMVLGGLALALTTTVLGLINAIPALIAYNYLKNAIRNFETEMEGFSNEMLSSIEMQYREVE